MHFNSFKIITAAHTWKRHHSLVKFKKWQRRKRNYLSTWKGYVEIFLSSPKDKLKGFAWNWSGGTFSKIVLIFERKTTLMFSDLLKNALNSELPLLQNTKEKNSSFPCGKHMQERWNMSGNLVIFVKILHHVISARSQNFVRFVFGSLL